MLQMKYLKYFQINTLTTFVLLEAGNSHQTLTGGFRVASNTIILNVKNECSAEVE